MTDEINKLIAERSINYGGFDAHAITAQAIKQAICSAKSFDKLSLTEKECLSQIASKLSRWVNGDSNQNDTKRDIAGYALGAITSKSKPLTDAFIRFIKAYGAGLLEEYESLGQFITSSRSKPECREVFTMADGSKVEAEIWFGGVWDFDDVPEEYRTASLYAHLMFKFDKKAPLEYTIEGRGVFDCYEFDVDTVPAMAMLAMLEMQAMLLFNDNKG
jgi:hypothetical protein